MAGTHLTNLASSKVHRGGACAGSPAPDVWRHDRCGTGDVEGPHFPNSDKHSKQSHGEMTPEEADHFGFGVLERSGFVLATGLGLPLD